MGALILILQNPVALPMTVSRHRHKGFTLLELLVVLVIVSILLGAVSLNAFQSTRQRLQTDAQRISLLLQVAREEAIVRNRQTAFEANETGYQFLILNENKWDRIDDLELLRGRPFTVAETKLEIMPSQEVNSANIRIIFGREPVSRPFVLVLRSGQDKVSISADGVGHFAVE